MSTQDLQRHAKGTVVAGRAKGGKFAQKRRAEADARALSGFSAKDEQDLEDVLHMSKRVISGSWMNHTQVMNAREDIRQDAVIDLLHIVRQKNAEDEAAGLEPAPFTQRHGGMVRAVMSSKVQAVFNQGGRHEGGAGRKKLHQWKVAMEADLGRELSAKELDDLAEGIRLEFPPGRRPPIGYQHNSPVETSNHVIFSEQESEIPGHFRSHISTRDNDPFEIDRDDQHSSVYSSAADRLEMSESGQGKILRSEAKLAVWDTFREAGTGVPAVVPISPSAARRASSELSKDGATPHTVARKFLDGMTTPQEDEAFFTPFGGWSQLSDEQRDAVAEKVAHGPSDRGSKLWKAAINAGLAKNN